MDKQARLLVVDDERVIVQIFQRKLEKFSWQVLAAFSGEEALQILHRDRIDLLITDISMPEMNGIELMQQATRLQPDLQCIVMTGFSEMETAVQALRLGAINYFSKPVDFESLQVAIQTGLEKSRLLRELKEKQASLEQANRELALEVNKNKMILDAAGEGIIGMDIEGRVTFINPAAGRMLGWQDEEIIGRHLHELAHHSRPDGTPCREQECQILAASRQGRKCRAVNDLFWRRNGRSFPVEYISTPILDKGQVAGTVLLFSNIADRKLAERKLMEHLDFLQVLLDTIPVPVFYKDLEGRYRGCNKAFEKYLGRVKEEIIGKTVFDIAPGENAAIYLEADNRLLQQAGSQVYEAPFRFVDGTDHDVIFHKATYFDRGGQVAGLVGIMLDITDRKRTEEELRIYRDRLERLVEERTAELKRANEQLRQEMVERVQAEQEAESRRQQLIEADKLVSLGVLVAGVAHEINNPNTFIMMNAPILRQIWNDLQPFLDGFYEGNGEFCLSGLPYTEMRQHIPELFSGIQEGSERIRQIVMSLKNYARKDMADLTQNVNVNEVLKAALTLLANPLKRSTDYLEVVYGENLPEIKGNFQRIEQVLINIIQNSCQALADSSKKIAIATFFDLPQRRVVVEIADEGRGIPAEHLRHIKDPFFTTKRDSGGTGLGLSISAGIMEEHGGHLLFDSTVGKGTTVRIVFPVSPLS